MSSSLPTTQLPDALKNIRLQPLFAMRLDVNPMLVVGETPGAYRRVGVVTGGSFEGDRLSGKVLDGGSDWQTIRKDGAIVLDVKLVLKTHDDVLIAMQYQGFRHGPAEVLQKLDRGETVDPASYYFRITPLFEVASEKYNWLNRVIAVGTGHRFKEGPLYSVFEVL
jgi:hypothetical protein